MNKPNVIFLIQDQMQQGILKETSDSIMPNLHVLMADSVTFDRAYTCNAICSPSRASLLTGTLPHVHGMVDCTHTVPKYRAEFDDSLDTITQSFRDSGYQVSYFGKWHIERTHQLEKFGIDTYQTERHMPSFDVTIEDKLIQTNAGYTDRMICGIFSENSTYTEENYLYQAAMQNIESQRGQGKPFCTFISTYAPHDPYCVPREVYDLYEDSQINLPDSFHDAMLDKPAIYRRMRSALKDLSADDYKIAMRCYYSYCTLVDIQVGKLVQYLKDKSLYDQTMIVFIADHGDMMGAHGLMMKSVEPFEEVYHIPLIIKMPHQEYAGKNLDFLVSNTELGPTVLELAGCRPIRRSLVGMSVVPWMLGQRIDPRVAYAEFFGQRYAYTQRIVWEDHWKYVFNAFDEDELYNLEEDPGEINNLSNDPLHTQKKMALCSRMWERVKETDDTSLLDAEYYLMRFAPVGPGAKKQNENYSVYNKFIQ